MNSALLYQKQQQQTNHQIDLESEKTGIRLVQSGKVYRQLFEAQVQLSDAYDRVKEKYKDHPPEIKVRTEGIPLVKEGRNVRGVGILDQESELWINAPSTDLYVSNPIFDKFQSDERKKKLSKIKKKNEKEDVSVLPDTVVPASEGSNIEARLALSRKKKHNECWEDMVQEIALVNLSLEPKIKKNGKAVLQHLHENDVKLEEMLSGVLQDDSIIRAKSNQIFDDYKGKLLIFTETRKEFIDQMDQNFLDIENDRVHRIRNIFCKYAEKLFQISFLAKPDIEKLFDAEIQQLNNQILINKSCYTQLYVKLITGDIERERNQINSIDARLGEWRVNALDNQVNSLNDFIENLNMIDPEKEDNKIQNDLCYEQHVINENRVGLIDALRTFKPPESTKTAVYKWYDSIKEHCKHMDEINTNYVTKLRVSNEESNQKIINKMEETLKYLIDSKIVSADESKDVLEKRLLPIWSRKQKGIEEYIERIEQDFEELSQLVDKEVNALFKYLQGASHIWDMHEIGLVKKERALQELLQDSRKDHDSDNQKREEKLDSILDQMREASAEKDLKRLLVNVTMQLDSIKRGYTTFSEAQLDLVKQYPQMVRDELEKYENQIFTMFSVQRDSKINEDDEPETSKQAEESSMSNDLAPRMIKKVKDTLTTERGTKLYVIEKIKMQANKEFQSDSINIAKELSEKSGTNTNTASDAKKLIDFVSSKSLNTLKESVLETDQSDILAFDELIPNTQIDFLKNVADKNYLKNAVVPLDLLKEAKDEVRMNFLNHLENWFEEGIIRSSSIVAAKSNEIEKELELRLHLHEPRFKRAEMDVHNVRASEIIMHDERVERHCAGVEESMEKLKNSFEATQSKLGDMSTQNKSDVFNLEVAFLNASKSKTLISLTEQLGKQKNVYMESVKATLRGFRSELDETLSFLRSANVKFRLSFNDFTSGGNFSSEEIDAHKKRLEKMAALLDSNETGMLKELEKIEKRYLDEAVKVITQFQDKFKFHLVDLQFIEKISRWLNETQIKIKTHVNKSNLQAKQLSERIKEFEKRVDCCERPNLDKMQIKPSDLLEFMDQLNLEIYERAFYLKCFKDEDNVPAKYAELFKVIEADKSIVVQGNLATSITSANRNKTGNDINGDYTTSSNSMGKKGSAVNIQTPNTPMPQLKSNSKANAEDAALTIMKTILANNEQNRQNLDFLAAKSESSMHGTSARMSTKTKSRIEKEKAAKSKLTRRAKTRDEMYSYYCTFGEFANPGNDFKANIINILRETLEGILTNSEVFYRELQQQNRHPTRPQSIKESYVEFADTMILKLKSYLAQCDTYHNQCLKEFRDCLTKYEILCSSIPALVVNEIYESNSDSLVRGIRNVKSKNLEKLSKFDVEKVTNESMLKPNLGHPNMKPKLDQLNKKETERQAAHQKAIASYIEKFKSTIGKTADNFLKDLSNSNEVLLLKFDELLTEDDVFKPDIIPEKHHTGELIRRQKAGLPLEDGEPKPLIKREPGSWKGIDSYEFLNEAGITKTPTSASINTAKTTLAHKNSSESTHIYHEKFKEIMEENFNYFKTTERELAFKANKWEQYWANSINQIKELYN